MPARRNPNARAPSPGIGAPAGPIRPARICAWREFLVVAVAALFLGAAVVSGCAQQDVWHRDFEAGLAAAQRRNQPAVVYFDAPWCSWCQLYKESTLDDARVRRALARDFVAILVDFDARPDLAARYRVRGLPYTVVLGADGRKRNAFSGVLTAPDLLEVLAASLKLAPQGAEAPAPVHPVARSDAARLAAFRASFLQHVDRLYAPEHKTLAGRFENGATLKRPSPLTWLYLTERRLWGERVRAALGAEHERLRDPVGGGFFNFLDPARPDAVYIETSKLLEGNAWLSAWFALAAHKEPRYREAAAQGYDYLQRVLRDEADGGFFQAQMADQRYYALTPEARRRQSPPALDRIKRADTNAQAAWALALGAEALGNRNLLEAATRTIDFVLARMVRDGRLYHALRDDRLSGPDELASTLWLLAAGAEIDARAPDRARGAALRALASRAAGQLADSQRAPTRLSNEAAGLLAWVAGSERYAPLFAPATVGWALGQLRIETDSAPDDLVIGLRAWERWVQPDKSAVRRR
jgi:thioredoxin-related protein